jgi:hypothetical protein
VVSKSIHQSKPRLQSLIYVTELYSLFPSILGIPLIYRCVIVISIISLFPTLSAIFLFIPISVSKILIFHLESSEYDPLLVSSFLSFLTLIFPIFHIFLPFLHIILFFYSSFIIVFLHYPPSPDS